MNLNGIRVTTNRPDEYDPDHAEILVRHTAYDDPPQRVIPDHLTDEYFAARIRAAGILARLAVIAHPHLDAEKRAHGCGTYRPGEPLTAQPGAWGDDCHFAALDLEPNGDGSVPITLCLYVPAKRARAWASACKEWLADLARQDTPWPPYIEPTTTRATVHHLRLTS